jgi:hypothetical protein
MNGMEQERPFPKLPVKRAAWVVLPFTAFAGLVAWLTDRYISEDWLMLVFLTPAVISWFYYNRRRCPECRGRLVFRKDYTGRGELYRIILDCPRCQIAWDTGDIADDSPPSG